LIELTFYTTDGCHLCEEAKVLLQRLLTEQPERYQVEIVDIIQSNELVEKYGVKIPVVKIATRAETLGWPFGYLTLLKYVNK